MNIEEIMRIDVINLKMVQHEALKNHVIEKLKEVEKLVMQERYSELQDILAYSPAGDGYGKDNYFINFGYDGNEKDLCDVLDILKGLKK